MSSGKSQKVFDRVEKLYQRSEIEMGRWMWHNHVQWVASKALELAGKYGANEDKVVAGALLHDLGDVKFERSHPEFDLYSESEGLAILSESGFSDEESREVMELIVQPHSCYAGNLPTTLEGKILATADAMFHLETSFFPLFCWGNRPSTLSYQEWQVWVEEKLERDYNAKIFFEDEKKEVLPAYEALRQVFGNKTLDRS